jgi:hypothetical protein
VRTEGSDIVIDTALKSRDYLYWAFVLLRNPLTSDGLEHPVAAAGPEHLFSALNDAPLALDVLDPNPQYVLYEATAREIAPLGLETPASDMLLISGLVGACLALAATLWRLFARKS